MVNTQTQTVNYQFCGLVPDDYYIWVDKIHCQKDYKYTTSKMPAMMNPVDKGNPMETTGSKRDTGYHYQEIPKLSGP